MQGAGQRSLSDKELRCLRMLESWEELADNKKYFGTFTMTEEALETCTVLGIAQPLAITKDRSTNTFDVRFDLIELHRYIMFVCDACDVTENIDGTMTTHDGYTYPIKFKERPVLVPKKESNRK